MYILYVHINLCFNVEGKVIKVFYLFALGKFLNYSGKNLLGFMTSLSYQIESNSERGLIKVYLMSSKHRSKQETFCPLCFILFFRLEEYGCMFG